jgi:LemA protein
MKKKTWLPILIIVALVVIALLWGIGVRNKLVQSEENVTQAWAQVENVYKRRADLIPQLVATVQGAANYEKSTMTEVGEARAKAGSVQIDANNLTEANVAEFQRAQDQLSSALTRSMNIVVERYPELTATQGFRDLQTQLEGTENRITTERGRFNETVNVYNKQLRVFPNNVVAGMCGFEKKGYFTAPEGSDEPVEVKFDF